MWMAWTDLSQFECTLLLFVFPRSVNLHSALWYCIHCCYRLDKTKFCFCCSKREHLFYGSSKFQIMFPYPVWGKKKSHTFQNQLTVPKSSPGCLNCGTTDILDQIIIVVRAVLCTVEYLAASLASAYWMSIALFLQLRWPKQPPDMAECP